MDAVTRITMSDDYNPFTEVKPSDQKNNIAWANPLPGDYWNEMFCPYFVVLEVRDDTLIVCDKTKEVDANHWTWDLEKAKEVHRDYMDCVKYQSIIGYVADVYRSHDWAVEAWKELGSPYVSLEIEMKQPIAADFKTVMEQGI